MTRLAGTFYSWLLSTQGYMVALGLILTVAAAGIAVVVCKYWVAKRGCE